MDISKLITELENKGVITISNAIDLSELNRLRAIYDFNWNEIKNQLDTLHWKRVKFYPNVQVKTGFFSKAIYDNKLVASYHDRDGYGDSQIINMGNNRYDFMYGFEKLHLKSDIVDSLMQSLLHCEYDSYIGALPVLEQTTANNGSIDFVGSKGIWHRDAYSLFDDETIDLMLKPFYYTVLIPLDDMDAHGRTTEFILGSHRINLFANGICNNADLEKWCNNDDIARYKLDCKAGDVCIFHGYLIHRGLDSRMEGIRVCYAVYKKNWYNDEPEENYILEESGIIIK
jgi:hypothetical protein